MTHIRILLTLIPSISVSHNQMVRDRSFETSSLWKRRLTLETGSDSSSKCISYLAYPLRFLLVAQTGLLRHVNGSKGKKKRRERTGGKTRREKQNHFVCHSVGSINTQRGHIIIANGFDRQGKATMRWSKDRRQADGRTH